MVGYKYTMRRFVVVGLEEEEKEEVRSKTW